jgi:hypothetical protein
MKVWSKTANLLSILLTGSLLVSSSIQEVKAQNNANDGVLIAQVQRINFSTYYLFAKTDGRGFFSVSHGLPSEKQIYGMLVAVQHVNGNWHSLELSNAVDNRFWWDRQSVSGVVGAPNFYNRPVKIILFVTP